MEMFDKALEVTRDRYSLGQPGSKLIFFQVLRKVKDLEQRLKHPAGRSGCRDKFHEPVLSGSRCVQIDILACLCIVDLPDTVTNGARSSQPNEKIRALEYFNLFEHPVHGDAQGVHLLTVRIGKPDCHEFAFRRFESKRQARPIVPGPMPEKIWRCPALNAAPL